MPQRGPPICPLKKIWNAVKRDPRRRGLVRAQHCCRRQRAHAVLLIQFIHSCHEPRPAARTIKRVEKIQRVQAIWNESIETDADEVGLVVPRTGGPARPQPRKSANQSLVILTLAQLEFRYAIPSSARRIGSPARSAPAAR